MISFIILTWNSEKYIEACILSIFKKCQQEGLAFEIIAVDNGSQDRTKALLDGFGNKKTGIIKIFPLNRNMGTTYPRNLALRESRGHYICIIDSDTRILEGSLLNLLKYIDNNPSVGILAPKLILPSGRVQNSVKKFPTFTHKFLKLPKIFSRRDFRNLDFYTQFPFKKITVVESAISACWIFKSTLIRIIGYFDEKIFYAPEDLDYCLRVWKSGKCILYYPEFALFHDTQQITHQNPFGCIAGKHLGGLFYYFRKHGGWFTTKGYQLNHDLRNRIYD